MSVKTLILVLLIFALRQGAEAEEITTPVGLEYCTVCHGSQLKGNINIGAPRLTDLSSWYVERQLHNFKLGKRGAHPEDNTGEEMMLMVGNLTDKDITEIANWVTKTDSSKPEAIVVGDINLGKQQYQSCAACHGPNGGGNKALGAPKLNGLNDWYLVTQLNHFRLGYRGTNPEDTYGQQMKAAISYVQSEQDAANLAAYIYQLN